MKQFIRFIPFTAPISHTTTKFSATQKGVRNLFILTSMIVLNALFLFAQGPTFDWVKQIGSTDTELATNLHVDANGNKIISGKFNGTLDFDPGPGTAFLTASNLGNSSNNYDYFVQKMDASGNFLWAYQLINCLSNNSTYISSAIDEDGNIFTFGQFKDSIDVDPGVNEQYLYSSNFATFVQKVNPQGELIWGKKLSSSQAVTPHFIRTDHSNNIILSGIFSGNIDFDLGTGSAPYSSNGQLYRFLLSIDGDGNFNWVNFLQGTSTGAFINIIDHAVTSTNETVALGYYDTSMIFFNETDTVSSIQAGGFEELFLVKYAVNGALQYVKNFGYNEVSNSMLSYIDLAIDTDDNIILGGEINDTIDADPGSNEALLIPANKACYLIKLDANGDYLWSNMYGETVQQIFMEDLETDENNNIYAVGLHRLEVDFDPGPNEAIETTTTIAGDRNAYILKLTANGDFVWVKTIGGDYYDGIFDLKIKNGAITAVGGFQGEVDFNNDGTHIFDEGLNNSDVFVINYFVEDLGVDEVSDASFILYPNPAKDQITIVSDQEKIVDIAIYSLDGRHIMSQQNNNKSIHLSTAHFDAGSYVVRVETETGTSTKLLCIQK